MKKQMWGKGMKTRVITPLMHNEREREMPYCSGGIYMFCNTEKIKYSKAKQ